MHVLQSITEGSPLAAVAAVALTLTLTSFCFLLNAKLGGKGKEKKENWKTLKEIRRG